MKEKWVYSLVGDLPWHDLEVNYPSREEAIAAGIKECQDEDEARAPYFFFVGKICQGKAPDYRGAAERALKHLLDFERNKWLKINGAWCKEILGRNQLENSLFDHIKKAFERYGSWPPPEPTIDPLSVEKIKFPYYPYMPMQEQYPHTPFWFLKGKND